MKESNNARKVIGVVLAGGIGTRLFGSAGGSKALFSLNGHPLIYYSLAALQYAGIDEIAIVVRESDHELRSKYPDCEQIQETGVGTLPAVLAAAMFAAKKQTDAIISSCDLVCPLSCARTLVRASSDNPDWFASFGVTTIANDQSPIWVHSDAFRRIINYGKGIEPSGEAFASIRFATLRFLELMIVASKTLSGEVDTDTKLMRHLILNKRVVAGAIDIGPALDVDDEVDAKIAEDIARSFSSL